MSHCLTTSGEMFADTWRAESLDSLSFLCVQTRVPTSQLQTQGQMQAQAPPPAQVALAKPPVVSVPAAVVSSPGVTTLPMNVAGISVAIGQPQKATGACHTCWSLPGLTSRL